MTDIIVKRSPPCIFFIGRALPLYLSSVVEKVAVNTDPPESRDKSFRTLKQKIRNTHGQ